jgi:hypothetical protein
MRLISTLLILFSINISLMAQSVGVNLPVGTTPNTMLDVNGGVSFREGTALTCVNGVNSNIALANYSFYRITGPTAAFSITGFGNGVDGRVLTIINASGQTMTLSHLTTSTAANQINTGGSAVVLPANGVATMMYNANLTKWIVSGTMGTAPSFTSITNGSFSDSLVVVNNGVPLRVRPVDYIETYAWGLDGNTGTTEGTNYVGTTDAQSLVFKTAGTEGMRLSTAQNLGIGTTTPLSTARLHVENTSTNHAVYAPIGTNYNYFAGKTAIGRATSNPTTTFVGTAADAFLHIQDSVTTVGTSIIEGLGVKLKIVPTTTFSGGVFGVNSRMHTAAYNSQNITTIESGNFDTRHYGTGTLANSYGIISRSVNLGTGRINKSYGAVIDIGNYGGTIDSMWGLQIAGGTFGTLTNATVGIGLQVGDVIATTGYGIRQDGGNDVNYLAGKTGIGVFDATYQLDVSAMSGSIGNPLRLQGLNAGATTDSILSSASGVVRRLSIAQIVNGGSWGLLGNSSTVDGTNFIGTTDNIPLSIRVNNIQSGRVDHLKNNTFYGWKAGLNNSSGINNVFIGDSTGFTTTSGYQNAFIGNQAGFNNTTGYINQFIGDGAGFSNTTGWRNTAIGFQAGYYMTTGAGNILMGRYAGLSDNTNKLTGDKNVAIGDEAGKLITTGYQNTFMGDDAGFNTTTGFLNTAIGQGALYTNTTGTYNTAIGHGAGYGNTTASNNTWVGKLAAYNTTTGANNTVVGESAGINVTTGSQNVFLGSRAGFGNVTSTGSDNVFLGYNAAFNITSGGSNIGIGRDALGNISSGSNNVGVGQEVLYQNTTGWGSTAIGHRSMYNNTTGTKNTAVGDSSLYTNNTGYSNTAMGYKTLGLNNSGYQNTAVGQDALPSNNTGNNNTALGQATLVTNTTGSQNVAVGQAAAALNTTGTGNTAVGQSSSFNNQTSGGNTALGSASLYFNTAANNTAIGASTMYSNTTGTNNTATGLSAMNNFQTGSNNTANGYQALVGSGTPSANTGSNNVAIGYQAHGNAASATGSVSVGYQAGQAAISGNYNVSIGYQAGLINQTGSNNTFVGNAADVTSIGLSNAAAFGYNAKVAASNSLILGGTGASAVNVGIGTTTPLALLHLSSNSGGLANDVLVTAFNASDISAVGIRRARGTDAAPSNVVNGDQLGGFHFYGYIGGAFNNLSRINATYKGDGTTALSTLDFMTNGVTQAFIDENGYLGVNNTTNSSRLDVNGSVGAAITTTATSITLDATHFTVILTGGTPVITLPTAASSTRRMYNIVNNTGGARTISTYIAIGGVSSTSVANNSAMTLQSNGTSWYQIR